MSAKHIKFLLVFFVTLFSINSYSLQLGKVIFQSNQNSPLDVSIEVNLSSEDKIDKLSISQIQRSIEFAVTVAAITVSRKGSNPPFLSEIKF